MFDVCIYINNFVYYFVMYVLISVNVNDAFDEYEEDIVTFDESNLDLDEEIDDVRIII